MILAPFSDEEHGKEFLVSQFALLSVIEYTDVNGDITV